MYKYLPTPVLVGLLHFGVSCQIDFGLFVCFPEKCFDSDQSKENRQFKNKEREKDEIRFQTEEDKKL